MSDHETQKAHDALDSRRPFETEGVYSVQAICRQVHEGSGDYIDELLADKISMVRAHIRPGLLVDLCCATGGHLFSFSDVTDEALGIDFSRPYIAKAYADANAKGIRHIHFIVADAKSLPLASQSVGTLYSFSSLYTIKNIDDVFSELQRVLKPGGRLILDMQNSRSLNAFCVRRYYTDWAQTYPIPVKRMFSIIANNGLNLVEHRAFQILPLWAGKPLWLWPLLHPAWKRIMKRRIKGRMVDEWISNTWPFKQFSYRHLFVLQRD